MTEVALTADQLQIVLYSLSLGVDFLALIAGLLVFE